MNKSDLKTFVHKTLAQTPQKHSKNVQRTRYRINTRHY